MDLGDLESVRKTATEIAQVTEWFHKPCIFFCIFECEIAELRKKHIIAKKKTKHKKKTHTQKKILFRNTNLMH